MCTVPFSRVPLPGHPTKENQIVSRKYRRSFQFRQERATKVCPRCEIRRTARVIDFNDELPLHRLAADCPEEGRLWARVLREIREELALSVSTAVLFHDDCVHLPRRNVAESVHHLGIIAEFLERAS